MKGITFFVEFWIWLFFFLSIGLILIFTFLAWRMNMKITFDLTVKAPQANLAAEDTLMALLNYRYGNVTFREALYYAVVEDTLNPEIDGKTYNLSRISKEFLTWAIHQGLVPIPAESEFFTGKFYSLFIYNRSSHHVRLISGTNDFTKFKKDSVRASTPLSKDIWIVYYFMIPSFKYEV